MDEDTICFLKTIKDIYNAQESDVCIIEDYLLRNKVKIEKIAKVVNELKINGIISEFIKIDNKNYLHLTNRGIKILSHK